MTVKDVEAQLNFKETPKRDGRGECLHFASLQGEANSARVTISTSDPGGTLDDGEVWIKVEA